jgi:phage tail sheath gpL-like
MAETGSLSTANTLSSAANDFRQQVVSYFNGPNLPCEIAAAMATAVSAREAPNFNWDFDKLPLGAPPDPDVYTSAEVETALAAGTTPLRPNDARDASEIVRLVTTKTTEGGAPFENTKDLATVRTVAFTIRQIDAKTSSQFIGVNMSDRVLKRLRSVILNVLDSEEELEYLQNVEGLKDQLIVERDAVVATRAVAAVPMNPVPNLHQIVFKHTLFVGSN